MHLVLYRTWWLQFLPADGGTKMRERIPDNYDMWEAYDAEQQKWLKSLPECADCGHPIQTETGFYIDGVFICEDCIEAYRVNIGDYIDEDFSSL